MLAAGLCGALKDGLYGDLTEDLADAGREEAGKYASDVIAPLNAVGDKLGTPLKDGDITMPPGWKEAYTGWAQAGWNGLAGPTEWGGQGLPHALNSACIEMWNSASMAFGIGPVLTMGAIEALNNHGTDALKQKYLQKLTTGEWMGTMQLTEPQAGSDVGALRARAERAADGTYRITGSKIFITYGEHDLTDNIIHFVLARLSDAPPGTRGISLFLVPKFFVNDDGSPGGRNDARCHSIEHKLGIHGSPTCTMVYGDSGGAIGWLVGEENRGLACMFTMMNNARLAVGLQGVAIAERATQQAMAYANDRKQGRAGGNGAIINHPDVRRMLLTVRAYVDELRNTVARVKATNDPAFGATGARLFDAVDSLDRATTWLLGQLERSPDAALSGATPYLRLFASAAGGCALAEEALAGLRLDDADAASRVALARFFAENIAVQAGGLETTVT